MKEDNLTEQQLIDSLSDMHSTRSRDPEILCKPSVFQFNMAHKNIRMLFTWQPALMAICLERGDAWTKQAI